MASLLTYTQVFARLRVNKKPGLWTASTRHRAPHKPLLLLVVLDLFEQHKIAANLIRLDSQLIDLFASYWAAVCPERRPSPVTYPFHHLQNDGVWRLVPIPGRESALAAYQPGPNLALLQSLILGARLGEHLYGLMCEEAARADLRGVLVSTYFDDQTQIVLRNLSRQIIKEPNPVYGGEWGNWVDWA